MVIYEGTHAMSKGSPGAGAERLLRGPGKEGPAPGEQADPGASEPISRARIQSGQKS